jgi:hypothetical protein
MFGHKKLLLLFLKEAEKFGAIREKIIGQDHRSGGLPGGICGRALNLYARLK